MSRLIINYYHYWVPSSKQPSPKTPPAPPQVTFVDDGGVQQLRIKKSHTPVQNVLTIGKIHKHPLSPELKCVSWLTKGVIHDVASSTSSSCGSRQYWMDLQGEVVRNTTKHLHRRAGITDIDNTMRKDPECQGHKITEIFSQQQIRDKFKNLVKKRNI